MMEEIIRVFKGQRDWQAKVSLIGYLLSAPEQRLWQGIRNWSGADYVHITRGDKTVDTFYMEGDVVN